MNSKLDTDFLYYVNVSSFNGRKDSELCTENKVMTGLTLLHIGHFIQICTM